MRAFEPNYRQSTRNGSDNREKNSENSGLLRRLRPLALLASLVALIAAHHTLGTGQQPSWTTQAWTVQHAATMDRTTHVHRADWIGDLIDYLDEILDILEDLDDDEDDGDGDGGDGGDGGS